MDFQSALSRLDKARQSVQRELSELDRKHTPKLGNTSETMLEGGGPRLEVRAYFRTLPEKEMTGKLLEAIGAGDLVTLRAVLLAPPVLLSIPEHVLVKVKTAYARTFDPEGFERRELLDKALAMIERSGRKFMGEVHNLLPPQLVSAPSNDKGPQPGRRSSRTRSSSELKPSRGCSGRNPTPSLRSPRGWPRQRQRWERKGRLGSTPRGGGGGLGREPRFPLPEPSPQRENLGLYLGMGHGQIASPTREICWS